MSNRLGNAHFPVGQRAVEIKVVNHAVSGCNQIGHFFGFVRRHVQHLYTSAGDLDGMVMPVLVPV